MSRHADVVHRLHHRLACHQALHDPVAEPRNGLRWLPELRRWQTARLERSFRRFLEDRHRAAAARFFLTDVYGDRDFSRRDADIARVLPTMQRLLPASLLQTVADGIALGALTHALDLRMAQALGDLVPNGRRLDDARYGQAYRRVGKPHLRERQIEMILQVGHGLGRALRLPGITTLLRMSRGPAHAAGLSELQGFLERGVAAFKQLGDVDAFLADIQRVEREIAHRLATDAPDPFGA